jgi:MFS family permease
MGVFAKDPFIKDAPEKFAQFGLMDVDNALICKVTGLDSKAVFVWCVAGNVVLFLVGAFMAGFWINRLAWQGLVSAVVWLLLYPGNTIINLGFPFAVSVALLGFLFVSFWVGASVGASGRSPVQGFIWRGLLLGIIFAMHVFVGAVGCAIAGVWFVCAGANGRSPVLRRIALEMILFLGAFLLVAWRWIVMHVNLRGALAVSNAHMRDTLPLDKGMLIVVLAIIVMLVLSWLVAEKRNKVLFVALMIYSVVLLFLAVSPLNNIIMQHTSWYMAHRILWLFPVGAVFAFTLGSVFNYEGKRSFAHTVGKYIIILMTMAILLPAVKVWGMKQFFLARTDEYDVHEFGYLETLNDFDLIGKIVLADPITSYYLRGMTGAYVCTVIPGEGSPALDYISLNEKVHNAMVSGIAFDNIDAVVLDIKNGATKHFAGVGIENILTVWQNNGWNIIYRNKDVVLMMRVTDIHSVENVFRYEKEIYNECR